MEDSLSYGHPAIPQCLLFLFFKKRKRTPFKKENVPI